MIEILTTGLLNSVQDLGRHGHLASGVSIGGAMDRPALQAANILVGNAQTAAGLEIALFPFRLRAHGALSVAVTGADCPVAVDGRAYPVWWAFNMQAGQTLTLGMPVSGARAYLAFAGGIDVPEVLGSRSTDLRSGFGGNAGKGLSRGDRLSLRCDAKNCAVPEGGRGAAPPDLAALAKDSDVIDVRVLPAAEHQCFSHEALQTFGTAEWTITGDANRMGCRLAGPQLELKSPLELLSHGIVPGVVQVPPSGQPIIQLADANTCGGYPKIATVISPDLWRLAQSRVGTKLRFIVVDDRQAVDAVRASGAWLADLAATLPLLGP